MGLVLAAVAATGGCLISLPRPLIDEARFACPADAVTVSDRWGTPLRRQRVAGVDQRWVSLEDVSPHLVDAVIAAEDQRFWTHPGVDGVAVGRALTVNLLPGRPWSGASTITQQTVKLVYGRPHGLGSKVVEAARAVALEEAMSKEDILEQYLNRVPFGDRIRGVGRASESYFGHDPRELTLGEAALIAGIPRAPSATEPRRHLDRALLRRDHILARMHDEGMITAAERDAAQAERPTIVAEPPRPWRAPRFVDRVLADRPVARAGVITSTLDFPLQERAEAIVGESVRRLDRRGIRNGAAVVLDARSGEVLAYVGAALRGPEHPAGLMDLASARRQPGSTLKPFVYGLLFETGEGPATMLDDLQRPMTGAGGALYEAQDYDGRERGPVSARRALSGSLNLAALEAARRVGPERIVSRLRALGMRSIPEPERVGAAVVLGGADVTLTELALAYTGFANDGAVARATLSREDRPAVHSQRRMPRVAAALVRDVLSDAEARRAAFGDDLSWLAPGEPFGMKTGTSSGWHDAWTVAFDDRFVVAVWLGDPTGGANQAVSGFEGAAPAAVRLLAEARLRPLVSGDAPEPPPLETAAVCALSGHLPGAHCPQVVLERFAPGSVSMAHCELHGEDGHVELPARFQAWVEATRPAGVEVQRSPSDGLLEVRYPQDGAVLVVGDRDSRIPLRAQVDGEPVEAQWFLDAVPLTASRWTPTAGEHVFVAHYAGASSEPVHVSVRADSAASSARSFGVR